MIVLDTSVLREPLNALPDPDVLEWLTDSTDVVSITCVSVGELLTAVRMLPAGPRRDGLKAAIERTLTAFADHVLPYDEPAARIYAQLQESRRMAGLELTVEDGMVAAICLTRGARLATHNVAGFQGLGVELISPWKVLTLH